MKKEIIKNENVTKEELKEVELKPSWSKLKSFHGKAMVGTKENGDKYLKSFGFLVCEIINGEVKIHNEIEKWDSKTTIRHINNFLFENKFETGNVKELTEKYIEKKEKKEKVETKEETKQIEPKEPKNKKIENPKIEEKPKADNTKQTQNSKIKKIEKSKIEKLEKVGA